MTRGEGSEDRPPMWLVVVLAVVIGVWAAAPNVAEFVGAYWPREREPAFELDLEGLDAGGAGP